MEREHRIYGALLRLFPGTYRKEHGERLQGLFRDTLADWRRERGTPGARFWLSVAWDTVRAAAEEWWGALVDVARPNSALTVGEQMSSLMGDVRFAVRQVARSPWHGLTVVLLMALGIAGNAAVFRVFEGLFLKPLPFEQSERLVDLDETAPRWGLQYTGVAYQDFVAWRRDNRTFEEMAVFTQDGANFFDGASPEHVSLVEASHDLDDVLHIEPELGRFFTPEEDAPDGPRVVLLTRSFWERRFAADPSVVGKTVSLNGVSREIIGVLPRTADFVGKADLWLPLREDPNGQHGWYLSGIGRLRDGVTVEQARADLLADHKGLVEKRPANGITSPIISSVRERYLGSFRAGSFFLFGAVGIVLLLACANIAGLMFARALAREHEIGVRLALGAPRGRIVRQLLTESMLLAAVGALAGAALGIWGSGPLVAHLADQLPPWVRFDLDPRFLAFTLAVTGGSAILFGLAPALRAARASSPGMLGGVRTTASVRRRRTLSTLVAAEVALAVALLVVGGLSVVDSHRVAHIDPGFAPEGVSTYRVGLPSVRYPNAAARLAFLDTYLERLRHVPGIRGAAAASSPPLGGHWGQFFTVEDAPERAEGEDNPVVLQRSVTPGYFRTMGVRIVEGRAFDDFDGREDGTQAVIVNETFVRTRMGDGRDPLGRRIRSGPDAPWLTVVGVARDVKHYGLDEPVRPGVYQPFRQIPMALFYVVLRTAPGAASPMQAARTVTKELDPQLPIFSERTMQSALDESLWTRRAMSALMAAFSGVALLLAVAGLYGVITYSVGQRTREIGVRMALGARAAQVRSQVVRQGMAVVAAGVVVGLGAALAMAGLVSRILFQVKATEPVVYVAVCVLLVAVAAIANWLPARRAAALDPMKILRQE